MNITATHRNGWWLALGGLILVALLGSYGYLRSGQSTSPPHLEVTPASYDFGQIPYAKVETDFQMKNTGGKMLQILSVSTSCGCTTAEASSQTLLPGQSARLHVTFDPRLMGEKGDILRMVYVKSNDAQRPEVEIELRGNVVQSPSEKP